MRAGEITVNTDNSRLGIQSQIRSVSREKSLDREDKGCPG